MNMIIEGSWFMDPHTENCKCTSKNHQMCQTLAKHEDKKLR